MAEKKGGPALLIGLMSKKPSRGSQEPPDGDLPSADTGEVDDIKNGLGEDLLAALHAKDAAGLYDAIEAIIHHCESEPHESAGMKAGEKSGGW